MSQTVVRTRRRRSSEPKKTPKCSREKDLNWFRFWFQVDLGFLRFVTAIGTQGAISKETKKPYFVRSYKVDVSSTGEDWVTVKDNSKPKVTFVPRESRKKLIVASAALFPKLPRQRSKQLEPFPRCDPSAARPLTLNLLPSPPQIFSGNHNPTEEAIARFPKQTLARYVRIRPLSWEQGICMRFEIYGCRTSGSV